MQPTMSYSTLASAPTSKLSDLVDVVNDRRQHHHDFVTRADQLYVDDKTGRMVARETGYREFELSDLALNQLATRLGVPGAYMQKCPNDLMAENVNHWLQKQPYRPFLMRCNGDRVRAVLSQKYSPIDHHQLLRWIVDYIGPHQDVRFELTEQQLAFQIVEHVEMGTMYDRLHPGVSIRNSEVGLASVEIKGLVYRTICLNGLILSSQSNFRRRHIGNASLATDVMHALERTADASRANIMGFQDMRNVKVPDMDGLFDRIGSRYNLTKPQSASVRTAFDIEPGESLYDAINALTRAGNDITLELDDRRQLQELGGQVLQSAQSGSRWLN